MWVVSHSWREKSHKKHWIKHLKHCIEISFPPPSLLIVKQHSSSRFKCFPMSITAARHHNNNLTLSWLCLWITQAYSLKCLAYEWMKSLFFHMLEHLLLFFSDVCKSRGNIWGWIVFTTNQGTSAMEATSTLFVATHVVMIPMMVTVVNSSGSIVHKFMLNV